MKWKILRRTDRLGETFYDIVDEDGQPIAYLEGSNFVLASLIAAAPELLQALEVVTDQLSCIGDMRKHKDGEYVEKALDAIASAYGFNQPITEENG